ncbi:hypothetical protein MTO96_023212 [Rhipicephalus appendiculatus]
MCNRSRTLATSSHFLYSDRPHTPASSAATAALPPSPTSAKQTGLRCLNSASSVESRRRASEACVGGGGGSYESGAGGVSVCLGLLTKGRQVRVRDPGRSMRPSSPGRPSHKDCRPPALVAKPSAQRVHARPRFPRS